MNKIFVTRSSMPSFEEYCEAIRPLWDSRFLTNMGTYHRQLERELAVFLRAPMVSLTVNGHMALELAIQSFDFPEGAEVITTPFTFISTTHAIVRNRLQPVFCDVKESDGTIDETKIEELITPKTVAILPVHVYGHLCNVDAIQKIADKYGLKVIYDAAHAFGVTVTEEPVACMGDASVFSFHATKVFNTIEGGAVTSKDEKLYEKLYNLKNFGIRGEELVVSVGANAKMNEFAAIMGLCNLKHLKDALADRKRVCEQYRKELESVSGIHLFSNFTEGSNYAYFPVLISRDAKASRDDVYSNLASEEIHARKYFYPITADQACFKNRYRKADLAVARDLAGRVLVLPLYEGLSSENISRICDNIRKCLSNGGVVS